MLVRAEFLITLASGMTKKTSQPHSDGLPTALIDRLKLSSATSEPYYLQLKRQLELLIENGQLANGDPLPSERVMAEALQLSRTTVKRCYDELRDAQRLSSNGRGGTVVQAPPRVSPLMGKLKGFTEEMQELGMTASTRVIEHEVVRERTLASIFLRPSTAAFLRLVRVRLADNVPMSREVAWYDLSAAPALEFWDTRGSAYAYLQEKCGIRLVQAEQTIEAVMSSDAESRVFEFTEPGPCLLIKRRSYSTTNQLIEYVEGTFRGDAYAYRIKLQT